MTQGPALQLYGRKKCRETQKGQRWLQERRLAFHFLDLDVKAPGPAELDSLGRAVGGLEALLDTQSDYYRKHGYAHLEFDLRAELLEHPQLLRTPVLRRSPQAVLGFEPDSWSSLTTGSASAGSEKR
ncbi:MAG: ArsC/Spx/MgsR family protein [Spirochaetales bacterium]